MSNINYQLCENPNNFLKLFSELNFSNNNNNSINFLYFTGTKDFSTGESWCPDCTRSEPVLKGALERLNEGSITVLECLVDRNDYKTKEYFYRNFALIQLKCVPTFIRLNGKGKELVTFFVIIFYYI